MSYVAADENGYLDDVASNSGLAAFRAAVEPLNDPSINDLLTDGFTEDPRGLAQALGKVTFDDPSAESVRAQILACAQRAEGALIVSDGTSDVEMPEAPVTAADFDLDGVDRSEVARRAWDTRGRGRKEGGHGPLDATATGAVGTAARLALLDTLKTQGSHAVLEADGPALRNGFKNITSKMHEGHRQFVNTFRAVLDTLGAEQTDINGVTEGVGMKAAMGPPKKDDRILEKALQEYNGHPEYLMDTVRATIAVDDTKDVQRVVDAIHQKYKVVREKNRFEKPVGGYRDYLINVKLPNGLVGEIQVHGKPLLKAKNTRGHALYAQMRSLLHLDTPEAKQRVAQLVAQSAALYTAAYMVMR